MVVKIMALVDPNGNVVNKIVVDTEKPFTPPQGWSMHEWDDAVHGPAYEKSLKNPGIAFGWTTPVGVTPSTQKVMALVDPQGNVVNKVVVDTTKPFTPPPGFSVHLWNDATDSPAYQQHLAKQGQQSTAPGPVTTSGPTG
jgi:hypothetical protein